MGPEILRPDTPLKTSPEIPDLRVDLETSATLEIGRLVSGAA